MTRNSGLLGLIVLGVVGNLANVPLFFGVDIIFGSIATLIVIVAYGLGWGILSAAVAGLYTCFLWNHPFAAFTVLGEAIFVGLLFDRFRANVALVAGAYWFVLGIPMVWLFYRFGLDMTESGATLAAVKQGANGVSNAIIASLILTYTPILSLLGSRRERQITVFENIFNIFVAAAMVPALFVVIIDARAAVDRVERMARDQVETISQGISLSVERWLSQHVNAIRSLAYLVDEVGGSDGLLLQTVIEGNRSTWPDFLTTFVTDQFGTTIAFDPLTNPKGRSTIGINFSDRKYFQEAKLETLGPRISDVFMARGGVFEPVVNVTTSYEDDGEFAGVIVGSLNVEQLRDILIRVPGESGYYATLLDTTGAVIATNHPDLATLMNYSSSVTGTIERISNRLYYRRPNEPNLSPMSQWNRSFLGQQVTIPGEGGWQLIVETPFFPMQALLYDRYIRSLGLLLGLALVILLGSLWIATRISKPLSRLSRETTNLPQRLMQNEKIVWPQSRMVEINVLVKNFRSTLEALQRRFIELESSRKELERAKEQAETANRLKSAFLANMSHEIRTPVGVMIGFADLITDEELPSDDKKQFAGIIKRNGDQLSVLIDDILDLSKVEAGYLTVECLEVSLRRSLEEVVVSFSERAKGKGLELRLEVPNSVKDQLFTDPVRFKQIVSNLVGNAVKFTSKGRITVTVLRNESKLELEVSDTGIGISEDDKDKLFKPFTQADESMTRKYGGTGLGLALSKGLSHLLGGDLILKYSEPQQGSVFQLTISHCSVDRELNSGAPAPH